jgi:hypothetical protein
VFVIEHYFLSKPLAAVGGTFRIESWQGSIERDTLSDKILGQLKLQPWISSRTSAATTGYGCKNSVLPFCA